MAVQYLRIDSGIRPRFFVTEEPLDYAARHHTQYEMPATGVKLVDQWKSTPVSVDADISGVLADWLEENRSELLCRSVGRDPEVRLDALIDRLRLRFRSRLHRR